MSGTATQRRWVFLAWLLLLLLVASWPIRYAQEAVFGHVVLFTGIFRIMLFVAIFAAAAMTAAQESSREQIRIVALGYAIVSLLVYSLMVVDFGAFYAGFAFNYFAVPSAIALIMLLNAKCFPARDGAEERRLIRILLIIAVPIALFGILQFALNDPILRIGFEGVPKSQFGEAGQAMIRLTELAATHRIRANSIFGSALEFGHFATLFAILCAALMLRRGQRPWSRYAYGLLALLFAAAVLSTNTRNLLLYLGCCGIGLLLIRAGLSVRALVAASLTLVGIFYAMIYALVALAPGFFAGFFDSISLFQRARGVYVTVNQFIVNADSLTHVLFGYGYMQSVDFSFLPTTIFDNSELDVYLYAGVCGVVLYLALLWAMFAFAIKQWRTTESVAWLAAGSLLFGTPLFSTLNIDLDQPFFVFVFALVVGGAAMGDRMPVWREATKRGRRNLEFGAV
jgi:branched-subunit amino acid transport protein